MNITSIQTLGALKESGYQSKSIKDELRDNLIAKIKNKETVFTGVHGYENTVIPELERAILSRHNINLLGLRGQAKTRLARLMVNLLDEYIPVVEGSEINDDPLAPISRFAIELIQQNQDETPIIWLHRSDRFAEKLATPDVTVADIIGDVDPIKAANLKLSYADDRVIHYGMIPRANRCIFVINELPDLQARIQVALFNILQEGDLQIRGFKLRLPLDIQFMFTANPEDYTNRGSIITPLKDRIESQILTHYPTEIEIATAITKQEANIHQEQKGRVTVPEVLHELLESVSFQARESEFVDEKSGVSARLSISGLENLVSNAERRAIKNKEKKTTVRITDFWGVVPAITGKLELVYEGEQVGPYQVAMNIIGAAIKEMFLDTFPHPDDHTRKQEKDPYGTIKAWFQAGNKVDLLNDDTDKNYKKKLDAISGLKIIVSNAGIPDSQIYTFMELMLHGLSELEVITKLYLENTSSFSDPFAGMFDNLN